MDQLKWKTKQAGMDRPIVETLKRAYEAGFKAADPEAEAEFDQAFSELMASAKQAERAAKKGRSPIGPPLGHFANLASSLWEFAYWWGGMDAKR